MATECKLPHSYTDEFGPPQNLVQYTRELMLLKIKFGKEYLQKLEVIDLQQLDYINPAGLSSSVMKVNSKDNFIVALKLTDRVSQETFAMCFARGKLAWTQIGAKEHVVFSLKQRFPDQLTTLDQLIKGTHERYMLAE